MIQFLGTIGAILLTWCAVPQLLATVRTGRTDGLSWGFLLAWGLGELFVGIFVAATAPDWRLLMNYFGNAAIVGVLVVYKM